MTGQTIVLLALGAYSLLDVIENLTGQEELGEDKILQTQIILASLLGFSLLPHVVWVISLSKTALSRFSFSPWGEFVINESEIEDLSSSYSSF